MKQLLILLCPLFTAFGGAFIAPYGLQGTWEMLYEGCQGVQFAKQIDAAQYLQEDGPQRRQMTINGNLLIEEIEFSPFCILHMESIFTQRNRDHFKLTLNYSKQSKLCRDQLEGLKVHSPANFQYRFRERLRPKENGKEGRTLILEFDGKLAGCPQGQNFEQTFALRIPHGQVDYSSYGLIYNGVIGLVKKGNVKELRNYIASAFQLKWFSLSDIDPLEAINLEYRNRDGMGLLMLAVFMGKYEMAQALIAAGASLRAHDRFGHSLAHHYSERLKYSQGLKILDSTP